GHRRPAGPPPALGGPAPGRHRLPAPPRVDEGQEAARRPPRAGRPQKAAAPGPPPLLAPLAAPLRGPQLDGPLHGVAAPLPRPGAGGVDPPAARLGNRLRGVVATHPARDDPPAASQDRLHHARVPLVPPAALVDPVTDAVALLPVTAVLGRGRGRRRIPRRLRRGQRGVALLLAHGQRRTLAAGVLRAREP